MNLYFVIRFFRFPQPIQNQTPKALTLYSAHLRLLSEHIIRFDPFLEPIQRASLFTIYSQAWNLPEFFPI